MKDETTKFVTNNGSLIVPAVAEALVNAQNTVADHDKALNTMFVLISGFLVFLMQCGFAMLTAGSVRTKNVKNVLIKNLLDACVGALAYYVFGYGFAYGTEEPFIGSSQFLLSDGWNTDFTEFFFQWTFAATAATIVSGSVAERTSFYAYLGYAFFLTAFVYPVVSHWVWGGGFLSDIFDIGMVDFAGCSVVHMVGGFAGLVGAILVGPRAGRFENGKVQSMPGHSASLATLGTFLLWFGWYGFNPGSTLAITGKSFLVVERCAVTTTLAAAAGGLTTLVVRKFVDHYFDLISTLNGVLAGLVAITASCAFVEPYIAVVIGAIGALVYIAAAEGLLKLKIDDPLEAFPIHGATGLWGCLAAGLFNRRDLQVRAGFQGEAAGLFYGGRNAGKLLGINLLGCVIIVTWTVVLIGVFFVLMKVRGLLRITEEHEELGNDLSKHGGEAYSFAEKEQPMQPVATPAPVTQQA